MIVQKSKRSGLFVLWRLILWTVLLVEVPVQIYLAYDWLIRLGLIGSIDKWFASAKIDTIDATAVIDFTCVVVILAGWLMAASPLRRRPLVLAPMVVLAILFPSVMLAVYFLFLSELSSKQS